VLVLSISATFRLSSDAPGRPRVRVGARLPLVGRACFKYGDEVRGAVRCRAGSVSTAGAGPGLQNQDAVRLSSPLTPFVLDGSESTLQSAADVLASCLALLRRESPDLARVVSAWPTLPAALRRAVLALIANSDAQAMS